MYNNKIINISIDGPAGAGKSSVAKEFALKNPNFLYINTGLMYRAIGYFLYKNNIDFNNENLVSDAIKDIEIILKPDNIIFIKHNNEIEEVTNYLKQTDIEKITSVISTFNVVREKLIKQQRQIAQNNNVVMDGRDIGSVVLVNADIKVYLDASVKERAKRRTEELSKIFNNENFDLSKIQQEIITRDEIDKNRLISPLVIPKDAVIIDSTNKSISEIVNIIQKLYEKIK